MGDGATRLCLAVSSLKPGDGGMARVARLMARALAGEVARCDARLRAISLNDDSSVSDLGVALLAARGSRLRFTAAVQAAALRSTHFFYDSLAMARAHNRLPLLRRPMLAWMLGIEVWEDAPPQRVVTSRSADVLLAVSRYTRARAERTHGGLARARVCWLGTETDAAPAAPAPRSVPPTVLILGRLEPGRDKGHRALIDCWPAVSDAVRDARLVIVGAGADLGPLRRYAAASRAASRIELRGFVADGDIEQCWAEASVFAMPSRGEGFGLVYVEAMRHAVPVIASVHDAAPEINIDGETGYNVDLTRAGELEERITHLLRDRDCAARLGANGQRRWQRHFCFSAFRERFVPLVREFLNRH
jgi:phosphatidylinositol alpha-1,6-mannosyltransferase